MKYTITVKNGIHTAKVPLTGGRFATHQSRDSAWVHRMAKQTERLAALCKEEQIKEIERLFFAA